MIPVKSLKTSFWIGTAILNLGFASLVVPASGIPATEFRTDSAFVGFASRSGGENASPLLTGLMIVGGAGLMIRSAFGSRRFLLRR
jgi:hypothetical protein